MDERSLSPARRRVLDALKRGSSATAGQLAAQLDLTDVAVRQHLLALESEGLVTSAATAPQGRGRPSVMWQLTDKAASVFPDAHAELTVGLIEAMREAVGEPGLRRIVEVRARDQANLYGTLLPPPSASLRARVEALARQRTAEGYMAEVVKDGRSWLLIEHHCPICEAAASCSGLCSAELDVFRRVLGPGVEVERTEHLLSNGERCVYRIRRATGRG
jgi:predicted ArsR family transcriptional regulator